MNLTSSSCALALLLAVEQTPTPPPAETLDEETPSITARMGSGGIDVSSADGRYRMHLWFRAHFRYSYPFDDAPTTASGFDESTSSIPMVTADPSTYEGIDVVVNWFEELKRLVPTKN